MKLSQIKNADRKASELQQLLVIQQDLKQATELPAIKHIFVDRMPKYLSSFYSTHTMAALLKRALEADIQSRIAQIRKDLKSLGVEIDGSDNLHRDP